MKMKIMTIAAVSAFAFAMPASAQYVGGGNFPWRIDQAQADIQAGVAAGTINRVEAQTLRERLRQLRLLERRYSYNGLTRIERQDLQARIQTLRQDVRIAARTNNLRYGQAGWIDANRDGYDDRDYDRDGRWDDDVYAQGGPYETDECAYRVDRGGIVGAIDNVLGRDPCYTVGERVTGKLDALPSRYRGSFRPGIGRYLGYGDGRIYEVDARTGVVTRVYRVD